MLIQRTCPMRGISVEMDINVTQKQLDAWRGGELIQNAMPQLSVDEREFIKTGMTPDVWDALCGDE